jgi:hypothetical protein
MKTFSEIYHTPASEKTLQEITEVLLNQEAKIVMDELYSFYFDDADEIGSSDMFICINAVCNDLNIPPYRDLDDGHQTMVRSLFHSAG